MLRISKHRTISFIKISTIILALVALFLTFAAIASEPIQTVKGFVFRVFDGNNIIVKTRDRGTLKVCLYGIDAPELNKINRKTRRIIKPGQPFASEAKSFLSSMVFGKDVRLDVIEIKVDRHKHREFVSIVWVKDKNVNLEMIKAGMAEAYVDYLEDRQYRYQFLEAEVEAKAKRLGIWSQGITYERPSDYRKRQ